MQHENIITFVLYIVHDLGKDL